MENNSELIRKLLKALMELEKSKSNDIQIKFKEALADRKIRLEVLAEKLKEKRLYDGLSGVSDTDTIDIDPMKWGIFNSNKFSKEYLFQNVSIDLGKDWEVTSMSIDLGRGFEEENKPEPK